MRYLSPIFVRNDSTDCVGPASQPSSRSRISAVTGVPLRVSVSVGDAFNSSLVTVTVVIASAFSVSTVTVSTWPVTVCMFGRMIVTGAPRSASPPSF